MNPWPADETEAVGGAVRAFAGSPGTRTPPFPGPLTYARMVSVLDALCFRPRVARPLPGHPAWGAPVQHYAWCPACGTDGYLVVSPYLPTDPRVVVLCLDPACPSNEGGAGEATAHRRLLTAITEHTQDAREDTAA